MMVPISQYPVFLPLIHPVNFGLFVVCFEYFVFRTSATLPSEPWSIQPESGQM